MKLSKLFPVLFLLFYTVVVFAPFIFQGKLPIPADTIVGLYHPWRDLYSSDLPFKNFLITDPVRQQYVWRELGTKWNPYSLAGTPLQANIQTAKFYPLNIIYRFLAFSSGWSLQIMFQTVLGGLFMWFYLRSLKLHWEAQALGILSWVGSGFFVAWLEWNTLVQVTIWIPLILLSLDKKWWLVFIVALTSSFFAGHTQIFLYVFILTVSYAVYQRKIGLGFILSLLTVLLLTSVQWRPMLVLFQNGIRNVGINESEWFLPWQNLVQFIAPDFFGNPATLNYFGVWNYGEFIGYVGIVPLIFALFGLNKKNIFWIGILAFSLLLMLPNQISKMLPQVVQPTRLLVLADFSLAMLAALGLNAYLSNQIRKIKRVYLLIPALLILWFVAWHLNLQVSIKNLILPTIFILTCIILLKVPKLGIVTLLALTVFDLSRVAVKFESFSNPQWLFPQTKIIDFLQEKAKTDVFRVAALDDRIMPPNFSTHYEIQMISGYDSLVLKNYNNLFGNINSRIIVPKDYTKFGLLNVRYLLTFEDINNENYSFIMQEGKTKVYENMKVIPRAFFQDGNGRVTIEKYTPDDVVIKTINPNAGFLVLLDAYYPEWKVFVDGNLGKIILTDGVFRGVNLSPGEHIVHFSI